MASTANPDAAIIAELNDLLQLDRDAVQAYTLAEKGLKSEAHRAQIVRFKGDHERHITELTALIEARGGSATSLPHLSSSPFKLAAQGLGDLGSDTAVLLAFKSNERLSRDKYQRAANQGHPADVQAVVARAAEDESTHYTWVQETLEQLGAGEQTTAGKAQQAFETGHAKLADVMEAGEKRATQGVEAIRERVSSLAGSASSRFGDLSGQLGSGGLRNVLIAVGVGFVASQLVGRSGGRGSSTFVPRDAGKSAGATGRFGSTRSAGERDRSSRDFGMPAL